MSENLTVFVVLDSKKVKEISIQKGVFLRHDYTFSFDFSILSEESRSFIYDLIFTIEHRDKTKGFYNQFNLDKLPEWYQFLTINQLLVNEYYPDYSFFEYDERLINESNIDTFIKHYFLTSEIVKDLKGRKYTPLIQVFYILKPNENEDSVNSNDRIYNKLHKLTFDSTLLDAEFYQRMSVHLVHRNKDPENVLSLFLESNNVRKYSSSHLMKELRSSEIFEKFSPNFNYFLRGWIDAMELYYIWNNTQNNPLKDVKREKEEWILENGSPHLKKAFSMGYDCQRQYAKERAALEFPQFVLDFDGDIKIKDRPFPSEEALIFEEKLKNHHPELRTRVHWMQKPLSEKEVIVIFDYLGKYHLYQEIQSLN